MLKIRTIDMFKIIILMTGFITYPAQAQESVCEGLAGITAGICNAATAQGCHDDEPRPSRKACEKLEEQYIKATDGAMPPWWIREHTLEFTVTLNDEIIYFDEEQLLTYTTTSQTTEPIAQQTEDGRVILTVTTPDPGQSNEVQSLTLAAAYIPNFEPLLDLAYEINIHLHNYENLPYRPDEKTYATAYCTVVARTQTEDWDRTWFRDYKVPVDFLLGDNTWTVTPLIPGDLISFTLACEVQARSMK